MRGACPGFVHLTDSGAWGGKAFKTELKCSFCEGKTNTREAQKLVVKRIKCARSQIFEKPLLTFSVQSSEQIQNVLLTASLASLPLPLPQANLDNKQTRQKIIKKVYYLTLEFVSEIFKRVGVDVTWNSLSKKRKEAEETRRRGEINKVSGDVLARLAWRLKGKRDTLATKRLVSVDTYAYLFYNTRNVCPSCQQCWGHTVLLFLFSVFWGEPGWGWGEEEKRRGGGWGE